ncbi:hypothetical protein [Actinomadura fulvescens]|uniref:hypothetical protein n=1 Tax=Actinomadura fulvescens TaxID=46160 RepID=UPI0031CFEEDE
MAVDNPLDLEITYEDPLHLHPIHDVDRPDHVAALTAAMEATGWDGPPLVVHDGTGLTGVHRIHAARAALPSIEVPTVAAAALFAAAGVDFDAEADLDDLGPELEQLYDKLPACVRQDYGMQA